MSSGWPALIPKESLRGRSGNPASNKPCALCDKLCASWLNLCGSVTPLNEATLSEVRKSTGNAVSEGVPAGQVFIPNLSVASLRLLHFSSSMIQHSSLRGAAPGFYQLPHWIRARFSSTGTSGRYLSASF